MHQKLILKVFEKIRKQEKEKTGITISDTATARLLSEYIEEHKKYSFGEKSLINLYRKSEKEEEETTIKSYVVVNAFCNVLGFNNFDEFQKNESGDRSLTTEISTPKKFKIGNCLKKYWIPIGINCCIIIGLLCYYVITKQRWMIWKNDKYIEVTFNQEHYKQGELKLYNQDRIDYFKKVTPDCSTEYFDTNGKVKIWYGKNVKKELEYFTALGIHPETGKTLHPITKYMIHKYICDE